MAESAAEQAATIQALLEQHADMMKAEPQGMVSKPHVCWATDALSHWLRLVPALVARCERAERTVQLLDQYTDHNRQCIAYDIDGDWTRKPCDCGFDEVIAALETSVSPDKEKVASDT